MSSHRPTLSLTPQGHLLLLEADIEAPALDSVLQQGLERAFARGPGHGLLWLGAVAIDRALPASAAYWREFGSKYVTTLCSRPVVEEHSLEVPPPSEDDLRALAARAPAMPGAEYLSAAVLRALWQALDAAFSMELRESKRTVQDFLKSLNRTWNLVGRVHFNLAENKGDVSAPFAFMATYTSGLSAQGKAQHLPLHQALRDYAGAANKERLLSLLLPVQRAAERCPWLRDMVDKGEIFHPLRWSPQEALQLLYDSPELERAGVVVRMPASWKAGRPPRPQATGTVGAKPPSALGAEALLGFRMEVSLEGERLSDREVEEILAGTSGLVLIRGRWVEVDRDQLEKTILRFREVERLASAGGLPFMEAMRMLAGADFGAASQATGADPEWSRVIAGPWLAEMLRSLRSPEALASVDPGHALRGKLRPYQKVGLRWLHLLSKLRLGACLADDMGLGKTIQVLSLLLVEGQAANDHKVPSLLVAPSSLLANWVAEIERFAPSLVYRVAHASALRSEKLRAFTHKDLEGVDLVLTSYGSLLRLPWLADMSWNALVLDEAQAIKNSQAKQSRAAKQIDARARIALTGTPIENRLGDLWSIFDFLNPGLLGTAREFTRYTKRLSDEAGTPYGPLRDLVRPYILRRLKTDPTVISDLPEKTEVKAYCSFSRKQAALYTEAVADLTRKLEHATGIGRRGLVLASLVRLKQVCNHPSQWLGDGRWDESESGKWSRLRDLCEVIAAKQEKLLVFTQFAAVIAPLAAFLKEVFGRPGVAMHGGTPVPKRRELVERFQEDESLPYFVLSLKVGGSGLNLTAASHVVHFDRWWNPAVENQATDRAFRIGQTQNVLVHKFICRGTVEEKIDSLIESKQKLMEDLIEGGTELDLTELADEDLLRLVALDLKHALE